MSKKIKHLVVDTTAFIRAANLQDIGENIYTIQEVVDEITNDRQRRKLVVLPYDLKIKDVFAENVKFVTEFSKKTGDYISLSATDITVMALTYQLEKELVGTDHLRPEPTMRKTVNVTGLPGYNANENKEKQSDNLVNKEVESSNNKNEVTISDGVQHHKETKSASVDIKEEEIDDDSQFEEQIAEQIKNMDLQDNSVVDKCIVKVLDNDGESDDDSQSSDDDDDDSDGGEWITPGNVSEKKKEMEDGEFEDKNVEIACITSDFAMQNVLKQIGLNVTSIDGRVIRQLRTFIFRCTTCFKTTSVMTKLFCPKCGHSTLKKVSVSVDDDGNQHIHINGRKPLTARGKRFSLPTPKGGQHFQYPILTEDQHIHKRFTTKMARNKTNALDPDYIAGFSPFVMKDVNSKSAVLGVRANTQDVKYWMKNFSKGKKK